MVQLYHYESSTTILSVWLLRKLFYLHFVSFIFPYSVFGITLNFYMFLVKILTYQCISEGAAGAHVH